MRPLSSAQIPESASRNALSQRRSRARQKTYITFLEMQVEDYLRQLKQSIDVVQTALSALSRDECNQHLTTLLWDLRTGAGLVADRRQRRQTQRPTLEKILPDAVGSPPRLKFGSSTSTQKSHSPRKTGWETKASVPSSTSCPATCVSRGQAQLSSSMPSHRPLQQSPPQQYEQPENEEVPPSSNQTTPTIAPSPTPTTPPPPSRPAPHVQNAFTTANSSFLPMSMSSLAQPHHSHPLLSNVPNFNPDPDPGLPRNECCNNHSSQTPTSSTTPCTQAALILASLRQNHYSQSSSTIATTKHDIYTEMGCPPSPGPSCRISNVEVLEFMMRDV